MKSSVLTVSEMSLEVLKFFCRQIGRKGVLSSTVYELAVNSILTVWKKFYKIFSHKCFENYHH